MHLPRLTEPILAILRFVGGKAYLKIPPLRLHCVHRGQKAAPSCCLGVQVEAASQSCGPRSPDIQREDVSLGLSAYVHASSGLSRNRTVSRYSQFTSRLRRSPQSRANPGRPVLVFEFGLYILAEFSFGAAHLLFQNCSR
jgi:hypothetical protein